MRMIFRWEGKNYEYDANACYDGNSIIALPDGRRLKVHGWLESLPPKPMQLTLIEGYLPGMEPNGTPAVEK